MEIRVVTSLTSEDEEAIARSILAVMRRVLDRLPIAYTIRMETTSQKVLEHNAAADSLFPLGRLPRVSVPS
jgi:hypothetical protein